MTCVVAIVEGESIVAGADSAAGFIAEGSGEIYRMHEEKVFVRGPYLFGYCGSSRIGQVLLHGLELPEPPEDEDLSPFLCRVVGPAIRGAVEAEKAGFEDRAFLGPQTVLILGCLGRLWCVRPDLSINEAMPYAAIGSGRQQAYGALHALTSAGVAPARRRVELALEAAAAFTPTVRGPFRFVTLGADSR